MTAAGVAVSTDPGGHRPPLQFGGAGTQGAQNNGLFADVLNRRMTRAQKPRRTFRPRLLCLPMVAAEKQCRSKLLPPWRFAISYKHRQIASTIKAMPLINNNAARPNK